MKTKTSSKRNRSRDRKGVNRPDGETRRAAEPEGEEADRPACRPKAPVPKGAVWWDRGEGHPCLRFFGAEVRHQRWDKRGWSLEDLHQASGLCRSFLCELENGKASPTEEVILELEAALEMDEGGLMRLVKRRWMKAVAKEVAMKGVVAPLARQMRAIRRALRREAVGAWLASCLRWMSGIPAWEPVLEA